MSRRVQVPGLPKEQACEAVRCSLAAQDSGIFLLMASEALDKSPTLRVFRVSDLERRPSVSGPLAQAGSSIDRTVSALLDGGFLAPAGRGKVSASVSGSIIKHRFVILRNFLKLSRKLPLFGQRVSDVGILRDNMRYVCEHGFLELD